MNDADTAYQIAEERIARARERGFGQRLTSTPPNTTILSLSPHYGEDGEYNFNVTPELNALNRLPHEISELLKIEHLYLSVTQVADLSPLSGLLAMETLHLDRTPVTDLSPLSGLLAMEVLTLDGTQVADLSPLSGLLAMKTLHLNSTQVADLSPLSGLLAMKTLYLNSTPVSDLSPLSGLLAMKTLDLTGTQVADLSPLSGVLAMKWLSLNGTQVADLSSLSGLLAMKALYLAGTQVADLSPLSGLLAMEVLYLDNTQVADLSPLSGLLAMEVLRLNNTPVADLSPLSGLLAMKELRLNNTKADLSALVAPGAAWEGEDHKLEDVEFQNVPVEDAGLAEIGERSGGYVGTEMLARLRELRDAADPAPPPPLPLRPAKEHVFLSYSRADADRAAGLRQALGQDDVMVWQDIDMMVGRRFREEIDQRIDAAAAVVVLWSENAVTSDYVVSEAERARGAGKLYPALLDDAAAPRPFDVLNAADLTQWAGDRADPQYQNLLWSLRERLTPAAPVGATVTDGGEITPEQQPVGAARQNENAEERARAIRVQVSIARTFADEAVHANAHQRLGPRLAAYVAALSEDDPLWESVDGAFDFVAPLLADEALDAGLVKSAARLAGNHAGLQPYLDKVRDETPAPEWPELDADDAAEAAELVGRAVAALADAPFGAAAPAFLATKQESFAAEADDARYDADPTSIAQRKGWLGRTAYVSLGFISAVGSAASAAAYAADACGADPVGAVGGGLGRVDAVGGVVVRGVALAG